MHVNSASSSQGWLMVLICSEFLVAKAKGFPWFTNISRSVFKQPGTLSTSSDNLTHAAGMPSQLQLPAHTKHPPPPSALIKHFFCRKQALEQDALRSFGYLVPGSVQGQVSRGLEHPALVKGVTEGFLMAWQHSGRALLLAGEECCCSVLLSKLLIWDLTCTICKNEAAF